MQCSEFVKSGEGRISSHADTDSESGRVADTGDDFDDFLGHPITVQQESVFATEPSSALPPRVIASQIPASGVRGPTAQPVHATAQSRSVVRAFMWLMIL